MYLDPADALGADLRLRCPLPRRTNDVRFDPDPASASRTQKATSSRTDTARLPMPFALTPPTKASRWQAALPGARAARDIALPPGRGSERLAGSPPLDRIGPLRRHAAEHHPAGVRPVTRYVAFLRGVNVGGVNLKMAEVADGADRGRILRGHDRPRERQRAVDSRSWCGLGAHRRPRRHCATRSDTTPGCWPTISTACMRCPTRYPFEREVEGHHSLRHLRHRCGRARRAGGARAGRGSRRVDRARRRASSTGRCPKTGTLDTTIGKTMGKKRYKSSTTTRNLRTIDKVLKPDCTTFAMVSSEPKIDGRADRCVRDRAADVAGAGARSAAGPTRSSTTRWRSNWSTRSNSTSPSSATPGARTWRCARWRSTTPPARYLVDHPPATVVALAEGLQTSFYRIAAGDVGDRVPLADRRSAADRRLAQQAAARVGPGDGVRAVRAGLQLDGPGRQRRRRVHHRRGSADVPAAHRGAWG